MYVILVDGKKVLTDGVHGHHYVPLVAGALCMSFTFVSLGWVFMNWVLILVAAANVDMHALVRVPGGTWNNGVSCYSHCV